MTVRFQKCRLNDGKNALLNSSGAIVVRFGHDAEVLSLRDGYG